MAATVATILLLSAGTAGVVRGEDRPIDGSSNNLLNPTWGAAGTPLARQAAPAYEDGYLAPSGADRPNPRAISNAIVAQSGSMLNTHGLSMMVFQWGQFIDHDMDLTSNATPAEPFDIPIPVGDAVFSGAMPFSRSHSEPGTGVPGVPRQQVNEITSYLDASMIYGSDAGRASALRSFSGGRLLSSAGDLLPLNTLGLSNGTGGAPNPQDYFVSGDVRANEQVGLTAMHTLMMREHNRLAGVAAADHPGWTDDMLYQYARKWVGAEVQAITYNEFLPSLLGSYAPSAYGAYNALLDPSIRNEFSTAFFRIGHTMLPPELPRRMDDGSVAPGGDLPLRDAFFQPHNIADSTELDYLLKGLCTGLQQQIDVHLVDDVRNFLFGEPSAGAGFDLAALNIQRGRDHGLADYNTLRVAYGLPAVHSFAEITSDPALQAQLQAVYGSVDNIDPWLGGLAEDPLPGAAVGPLVAASLIDQFTRLRDGDRFYYQFDPEFSSADRDYLTHLHLSDLIMLNSHISSMQADAFKIPEPSSLALSGLAGMGVVLLSVRRRPRRR